jgi:hypothetical protein
VSAGRESSSVGGRLEPNYLDQLSLGSRSLGDYLSNDCRDAPPEARQEDLAFAEYYIRERLGLKDHVYLVRLKRRFPDLC